MSVVHPPPTPNPWRYLLAQTLSPPPIWILNVRQPPEPNYREAASSPTRPLSPDPESGVWASKRSSPASRHCTPQTRRPGRKLLASPRPLKVPWPCRKQTQTLTRPLNIMAGVAAASCGAVSDRDVTKRHPQPRVPLGRRDEVTSLGCASRPSLSPGRGHRGAGGAGLAERRERGAEAEGGVES